MTKTKRFKPDDGFFVDHMATLGRDAVQEYASGNYGKYAPRDPLMHLLADLMHCCAKDGLDFDNKLEAAKAHFEYELSTRRKAP